MLPARDRESLAQEWNRVNGELARLGEARPKPSATGAWVEPSAEEAGLLARLDEIEFTLGREYLGRRQQDGEGVTKRHDGTAAE